MSYNIVGYINDIRFESGPMSDINWARLIFEIYKSRGIDWVSSCPLGEARSYRIEIYDGERIIETWER